ncbi:MAG TPA: 2-oxoglutarate dehydrogenase E1 component [Longimicrobiales bacterium]|nr:2-oxoglutarate dehydrogenase E1 component [Longimicrobiales bacterium]
MSQDTLFDSQNAAYAQLMYEEYARNPEAVPPEWRRLFQDDGAEAIAQGLLMPEQLDGSRAKPAAATAAPPAAPRRTSPATAPAAPSRNAQPTAPLESTVPPLAATPRTEPATGDGTLAPPHSPSAPARLGAAEAHEHLRRALPVVSRAAALVQAFRDHGHQLARLDPLGSEPPGHPQLSPAFFGTSMEELGTLPASLVIDDAPEGDARSVADALSRLSDIYAGSIGYEFEHLDDHVKVDWLWDQVESGAHWPELDAETSKELLRRICEVEGLEQFLHKSYLGQKRFSLEGTDMLVPMIDLLIQEIAKSGGRELVLGMAHRGRLNVLTHTVGVSYGELLAEFEGPSFKGSQLHVAGTGDVKYHHGAKGTREVEGVGRVRITLAPNPSHLEFVNPVVVGWARSRQFDRSGKIAEPDCDAVVPLLIHGDAAFAAEGVVAETLNMARLRGYHVGGTLHIIVNNQVGFTTDPRDGRSTYYASDLAKGYGIPIVHVNADAPEACLAAVRLATAYRARFRDEFVIDLVGYRRYGHNEGDEPAYTQPRLYAAIDEHPTVGDIYASRLVEQGVVTEEQVEAMRESLQQVLRDAQDDVREYEPVDDGKPSDERDAPAGPEQTGVPLDVLEKINDATVALPEGFSPHPKLWRQLGRRASIFSPNRELDWGHAETLAFGSLLLEGVPIRLTGQDSQRGTFSHRHLVLHDVETGNVFVPLEQLSDTRFEIYNSPLTETAVLGFEYGYSVGADTDMVLWEAQFGDFVNVAQPIIDQFMSSGRTKWGQYSRLILLLPHGYEGQGPEHSSARLERFLQLCAEDNMRVAYPTTPAQFFHLLRMQAHSRPERPLIVMTPKSLLRLPAATSVVSELVEGRFAHILPDPGVSDPAKVTRLVLCSGKIYYDLAAHARRGEAEGAAVARLELLYPFPGDALASLVATYPNLREVVWAQEEPRNMGALTYIGPRLRAVVPRKIPLSYVARPERASPAEGKAKDHVKQQDALVVDALGFGEKEEGGE